MASMPAVRMPGYLCLGDVKIQTAFLKVVSTYMDVFLLLFLPWVAEDGCGERSTTGGGVCREVHDRQG
jgi:hypothetical protein